jgi:hypothetical protein
MQSIKRLKDAKVIEYYESVIAKLLRIQLFSTYCTDIRGESFCQRASQPVRFERRYH